MKYILREITPLAKNSLFFAINYPNHKMDFPLHFHEDFELCLHLNARGKRTLGNIVEKFSEKDLILVGPNIYHCYKQEEIAENKEPETSIIQFGKNMYQLPIFNTKQLQHIKNMFIEATHGGIKFSEETADKIADKMYRLAGIKGFEEVLLFFEIMNDLATSTDRRCLNITDMSCQTNDEPGKSTFSNPSRRINKIINFVETNYRKKISLDDIAALIGMSPSAASRFFKNKTQRNFNDFLNNYRIDRAAQILIETEKFVSEICFETGFNNISNFNLTFRKYMKCTPNEYRSQFKSSIVPNLQNFQIER
jgi:AraC-like DNA-binding protein